MFEVSMSVITTFEKRFVLELPFSFFLFTLLFKINFRFQRKSVELQYYSRL